MPKKHTPTGTVTETVTIGDSYIRSYEFNPDNEQVKYQIETYDSAENLIKTTFQDWIPITQLTNGKQNQFVNASETISDLIYEIAEINNQLATGTTS